MCTCQFYICCKGLDLLKFFHIVKNIQALFVDFRLYLPKTRVQTENCLNLLKNTPYKECCLISLLAPASQTVTICIEILTDCKVKILPKTPTARNVANLPLQSAWQCCLSLILLIPPGLSDLPPSSSQPDCDQLYRGPHRHQWPDPAHKSSRVAQPAQQFNSPMQ